MKNAEHLQAWVLAVYLMPRWPNRANGLVGANLSGSIGIGIPARLYKRGLRYLLVFEPHVLRHREGVQGDRVYGMLGYPRAHPHESPQVDDRSKHHPLRRELLDTMQHGFPFAMVALSRLLLVQCIDVRIAPIRIGSLGVDERLHTGS